MASSYRLTVTTDDYEELQELLDVFAITKIAHARSVAEGRYELTLHFPDAADLARETYEFARRRRQTTSTGGAT